jgi:hypothetical protein
MTQIRLTKPLSLVLILTIAQATAGTGWLQPGMRRRVWANGGGSRELTKVKRKVGSSAQFLVGEEAKVKRSSRGSLPRLLRSSGGWLDRVTMVGGSLAQRLPAVAILGGPSAEAKGKMDPWFLPLLTNPKGELRTQWYETAKMGAGASLGSREKLSWGC